jgi:alkylhydroperoxidase/carboxymuconolactone decarboxylase family protein YurZ
VIVTMTVAGVGARDCCKAGAASGRRPISPDMGDTTVPFPESNQTEMGPDSTERKGSTMTETTSETPVLDLLASMTADSMAASTLDAETFMLVRIAALVAVDAPSVSYLMNLAVAGELDIDSDRIRGVLAAVAPIVGTPRVAAATGKIVEALAVELEIAELEEMESGEMDDR